MPREISPGIHWIQECGPDRNGMFDVERDPPDWYEPGESVHVSQSVFLFDGDETLLFDTLSPASTDQILDTIDEILDGGDLDYLVVSHPDVPHAGNTMAILREHPEATLVAPKYGETHELYHLGDAMKVGEGDTIDIGGHVLDFHEATFLDAPLSVWMSERNTNTLFPSDWLGFPHMGSDRLTFVDELDHDVGIDQLIQFHGRVFFWFQYVDVPKVTAEIDRLIEIHDPDVVAPAHGLVIREDPIRYMESMKEVVERIDQQGRVGTLG